MTTKVTIINHGPGVLKVKTSNGAKYILHNGEELDAFAWKNSPKIKIEEVEPSD